MTAHHEEPEFHGRPSPEEDSPVTVTILILTLAAEDFGAAMDECRTLLERFDPADFEIEAVEQAHGRGFRVRLVRYDGYDPSVEQGYDACLRTASARLAALGVSTEGAAPAASPDGAVRVEAPLTGHEDVLPPSTEEHELAVHERDWRQGPEELEFEEAVFEEEFEYSAEELDEITARHTEASRGVREDCRMLLRIETSGCDGARAHEHANKLATLLSKLWWSEVGTVKVDKPALLDNGTVRVDVEIWRTNHTPDSATFQLMELFHGGTWTRPVHMDEEGSPRVTATWYSADPAADGPYRIELWCQATVAR
ncbi:hypothetical protein [Actinopolyspora saharensis]|uniref:Uncharacterized protein n=1 Tax=Actinopolyspora saharensis TaxID=995062 RepID=A0A1H1GHM6_9ACTN|nr:hypothetical protein [Actinopolyspora saharensis]SDR12563.1 hypothetical protein SAMN04489718_3651 [Actinopolyspora saharensis]